MKRPLSPMISRRALIGGLAATLPLAAEAAVTRSTRPMLRGGRVLTAKPQAVSETIVDRSGLIGQVSFALRDLETGQIIEGHNGDLPQPPASVAKVPTALYALGSLGPDYRFTTRIVTTGPVAQGRVQGDLYLVGGGDPTLDTDGLAALAKKLAAAGVHGVNGNAYVVDTALPYVPSIDPEQPPHVGYSPAVSGLNLNFNRVHFEWKRTNNGYSTAVTARSARHDPPVAAIDVQVVDRQGPVFTYRSIEGRDHWTVASGALGRGGSRWLPVRACPVYVGEVFQTVAAQAGVRLPFMQAATQLPQGQIVAQVESDPLRDILVAMLKHSTNLTAEVAGLRASVAQGVRMSQLVDSGRAMSNWLRHRYALSQLDLVNHSGLSADSRMTAAETVQLLDIASFETPLPGMLKTIPVAAAEGSKQRLQGVTVKAKTGTLDFTRGLAGYIDGRGGKRLAFAIYSSNLPAREASRTGSGEVPQGSRSWRAKALRQEQALLRHWSRSYLL